MNKSNKLSWLVSIPIVLLVLSLIIFNKSSTSNKEQYSHFVKSIEYVNRANDQLNNRVSSQGFYNIINREEEVGRISYFKKAISETTYVDAQKLNDVYEGFGSHYRDEFVKGLTFIIEGFENNDTQKFIDGQLLLNQWGSWYEQNINEIGKK